MKPSRTLSIIALTFIFLMPGIASALDKHRIVVMTDIGGDPDASAKLSADNR